MYLFHITVSDVQGVAFAHVAEAEVVVFTSVESGLDGAGARVKVAQADDLLFYCFDLFKTLSSFSICAIKCVSTSSRAFICSCLYC